MRNGSIAILVDTNVPVYAVDSTDENKQRRAVEVLKAVELSSTGALTVQVLNEFFVTAIRKPRPSLTIEEAESLVAIYSQTWPILALTPDVTRQAIEGVRRYHLAFWDALLWASARLNGIPYLLTEDGPTGAVIEGVRWVNPFAQGFSLRSLRV